MLVDPKTPFEAGLTPGEPGRLELERKAVEKTKIVLVTVLKATPVRAQTAVVEAKKSRHIAFNLSASCASLRESLLIGYLQLIREATKSSKYTQPA